MKEPEISLTLEDAAWRVPHTPRYRYHSNPPTTVSLRLADLAPQIPEAARLPGFNAEKTVEFSCEEIFTGPVPKLSLSRLAELANEDVRSSEVAEGSIGLPVARLALAFRFINHRELIEEPPPPKPAKLERSLEDFAEKDERPKAGQELAGEGGTISPPAGSAPGANETESNSPTDASEAQQRSVPLAGSPSQIASGGADTEEIKPGEPETWRPITVFPIFRRKAAEPQVETTSRSASTGGREPGTASVKCPLRFRRTAARDDQAPPTAPPTDFAPQVPEAVLIEAERSHAPSRGIELVDQDALQAVFMTEEMLSIDRVVELCGVLPGIKSCILAHGAEVLASHNVPESIDFVSLSAHALEMLAAMRQSASRMGIGAVPAVTIHAEKGPITFFHQDDSCLLVMHKDRGFVPGVREKLQKVVEHLAQGDPALGGDDSRLRWAAKKPAT